MDVKMPKLDQDMESGGVTEWLRAVGDTVEKGEPIVVIETDKVTNEVEAPASGTLAEILVPAGGESAVGEPIGRITTPAGGGGT